MTRERPCVQINGGHENGGVLLQGDAESFPLYNEEEGDGHETRSLGREEEKEEEDGEGNTNKHEKNEKKDGKAKQTEKREGRQAQELPRGKTYYQHDAASPRDDVHATGEGVILLGMHEEGASDGVERPREGPVEEEERKDGSVEFHVRKKAWLFVCSGWGFGERLLKYVVSVVVLIPLTRSFQVRDYFFGVEIRTRPKKKQCTRRFCLCLYGSALFLQNIDALLKAGVCVQSLSTYLQRTTVDHLFYENNWPVLEYFSCFPPPKKNPRIRWFTFCSSSR